MGVRFREAMHEALYGSEGFYVRHRPARHFRTSAQSPVFARALARLVCQVDTALGHPARLDVVDVGAGSGELLTNLLASLPPEVLRRTRPVAVELPTVVPPAGTGTPIDWRHEPPRDITGVLLATEWLDNIPLDLAENGRYLWDGAPLADEDAAWIRQWWPGTTGTVEIGLSRDRAWASVVAGLTAGLALTVDYGHLSGTRPQHSTVAGFRDGRETEPRFDGSTDITCSVAMDSAGRATGVRYRLKTQREMLRALGVDGARPPLELAHEDPAGYVRALAAASEAATLLDPQGLGAHWWLQHVVGIRLTQ